MANLPPIPEVKGVVDMELKDKDLKTAVYESIGAASVCWESMSGTGVFLEDRARDIAEQLLHRIAEEKHSTAIAQGEHSSESILRELAHDWMAFGDKSAISCAQQLLMVLKLTGDE